MKVLKTLTLDKYNDTNRYTLVDGNVYKEISDLVGKRVFNYKDGDYIKLGIE